MPISGTSSPARSSARAVRARVNAPSTLKVTKVIEATQARHVRMPMHSAASWPLSP